MNFNDFLKSVVYILLIKGPLNNKKHLKAVWDIMQIGFLLREYR